MPLNWAVAAWQAHSVARAVRAAGWRNGRNLPIIYVPGILGVKLHDRDERVDVWGDYRGLLFRKPHHAEYALDDDNRVLAIEPLHHFRIVPGLVSSLVTAQIVAVLRAALGYELGRDLFFLGHDWRRDYRDVAARLELEIRRIRADFGPRQRVIIIGQSVSNLAIRYLMRTTTHELRDAVAKWYAFGPPWAGTFNAFKMLREGYYPASRKKHGFTPQDVATYTSCYQLLPREARVIDAAGRAIHDFDVYAAESWFAHGFTPHGFDVNDAAQRTQLQSQLDRARAFAAEVAGDDPNEARVPQVWFAGAANRAVCAAVKGEHDVAVTEEEIIQRHPELAAQTLVEGDDHIPLDHLTRAPCGPLVRSYDAVPYGERYVLIGMAKTHRALINYLPNLHAIAQDLAAERARS